MTHLQHGTATHRDGVRAGASSSKVGAAAAAIGAAAWLAMWVSLSVTPWIVRSNVQGGDLENVYTGPLALWAIVIVLHVAAISVGIVSTRRGSRVAGAIATTIGATGLLGLAIYSVATYLILPALMR